MLLTDFTTHNDIRAALGVAKAELKDATLSLAVYRNQLRLEFAQVGAGLVTAFQALPEENLRTDVQVTFATLVQIFATYAVAKQLTVSLPLFSPKEISDGKAHVTRYAQDPYKSTMQGINDQYSAAKVQLAAAFQAINSTSSVTTERSYFRVASPITDPVTGT